MHETSDPGPMISLAETARTELDQIPLILRRRMWEIIGCTLLVAVLAFGFSHLQQTKYSATAALYFETSNLDSTYLGAAALPPSTDPTREAASNLALVELPTVAEQTAKALGVGLARVVADVSASSAGQSDIVNVTATDHDPVFAAKVATSYAEQFVIFRRDADRAKVAAAQQLVNAQLGQLSATQRATSQGRSLQSQVERLSIVASLQTGNAEVVQQASVPHVPSSPRTRRNTELGLIVGLLLGIAGAFLLERLDRRVKTVDELETLYRLPVLAGVPDAAALAEQRPGQAATPPAVSEAFRMLRARLRYFNIDRPVRSLLVTSVAPQEGKTTVSQYLSVAAATSSATRVLLIEADLRRPRVAKAWGLKSFPGLAEVLTHNVELFEVVQHVAVSEGSDNKLLDVIVAGANPPNHAELLESVKMATLIEQLTSMYDLVVIDTPPTSVVSDAIPLMARVDGVVVVSAVGQSTRDGAVHLRQQLERLGAPALGVVANRVKSQRDEGGYYYGNEGEYADDKSRPSLVTSAANGSEPSTVGSDEHALS